MADLKNVSCPSCHQKYRLPDSIENRKVVCRECQFAFSVPGVGGNGDDAPASNAESSGSIDGAMFDSLDVDDLLNAKSSGLTRRPPDSLPSAADEAKRRQEQEADRADEPSPRNSKDKKRSSALQEKERSAPSSAGPSDPTRPSETPSPLPITVLDRSQKKSKGKKRRKKKKRKSPAGNEEAAVDLDNAQSDSFDESSKGVDAIDPEEQAVFDYARAVNGRKNTFAVLVALAIAIGLGGWFSVQEIERLKAPLTENEREILEDEGFRLKAARAPLKGQFAALAKGVPRVGVAPGVRLDRFGRLLDQQLPEGAMEGEFDPNAAFADQKKQREPIKREPPVDFDTGVTAQERASSFTVGKRRVLGPALAVSPRNVVFVPEGEGIASYDLVSKKQIDYKSVGRLIGRPDKVTALTTTHDARFMVAGFESGRVKLFQLDSQSRFYEITRLPQKHFRPVKQIAVSPDSKFVATVDAEAQVFVWDVTTGENKWKQKVGMSSEERDGQKCLDLAFSTDGQQLLVALTRSDVVLNSDDGNPIARKDRPLRRSAVVSPINRSTVSCTESEISGYALEGDAELWKKSIRKSRSPVVALGAAGTTGVFFDGGKSIIQFDLQTGDLLRRLAPVGGSGHQAESRPIFTVDGQYLLYGTRNYADGRLRINHVNRPNVDASEFRQLPATQELPDALELPSRNIPELWVTKEGKRLRKLTRVSLPDTGKKISAVTLNDDGLLFYSTHSGGLHVYDWTNGVMVDEFLSDSDRSISALAICGKWLAAGQSSGAILLYEVQASGNLKPHGGVFGHDSSVVGIRAMPVKVNSGKEKEDPFSIASLSKDGDLRVWEIPTRGSLLSVETFRDPPKSMVVLDDQTILVASTSRLATVNPETKKVSVEGSRKGGTRVALSPDGKKLAFVNRKEITIAKTRTGAVGKPVPLNQTPGAIQFTSDSRFLQIDFSKHLGIVNYRTGKTVETFDAEIRTHSALDTLFAISSGESLMAAVTKEGQRIIIVPVEK